MIPEKVAEPAVLKVLAVWLSTPTASEPVAPAPPTVMLPAPVRASPRKAPSAMATVAPLATFRSAKLFVQTSLLLPAKTPSWTSMSAPELSAKVAMELWVRLAE